jgi:hypothetical protein
VLENSSYKLNYDRSIVTDQTISNNRPDVVIFDRTAKEAYLTDVATPNSHSLRTIISGKIQKGVGLKEELIRMWRLKTACKIPPIFSSVGIIPNKLHKC